MTRRIRLAAHLSVEELAHRYRREADPVARSRWQILWLLAQGKTGLEVAAVTGYSAYWVGQIARRYNEQGPEGVEDRRHRARGRAPTLTAEQQAELRQALEGPPPEGEQWTGRTVAAWIARQLGRPVGTVPYWLGWLYLRRLDWRRYTPRPRHVKAADPAAQDAFKGGCES